jgi:hypothetical protein
MEHSKDRYKSVWRAIKSAAQGSLGDAKLFPFITAEAVTDLQRLRECPLMDSGQQQFWLEYYIWNIICKFSNFLSNMICKADYQGPSDAFPGDISLLKEIDQLRSSRQRSAYKEHIKLTASIRKLTNEFKVLGEHNWLDPKHAYTDSDSEGEIMDLQSVQNQFYVTVRSRGIIKPIPSEGRFLQLVLHMKRNEFKVDLLCTSEHFEEVLKASENIDPDRIKYTVRFVPNQEIVDALYGRKSSHEDVEFVEKELDVRLNRRFEIIKQADGEMREFVISARPRNIFEALREPRKLHDKLREAFQFLRHWKYLVGGDMLKKKWDSSVQLTTIRKALVLHKDQKREESSARQPRLSKAKKKALLAEQQQRRFSLSGDKDLLKLTPTFLKHSPNVALITSGNPNANQSPVSVPATTKVPPPLTDLEPLEHVPGSSKGKRKRVPSPESSDHVSKCAKFEYSSALNPGFETPELAQKLVE